MSQIGKKCGLEMVKLAILKYVLFEIPGERVSLIQTNTS